MQKRQEITGIEEKKRWLYRVIDCKRELQAAEETFRAKEAAACAITAKYGHFDRKAEGSDPHYTMDAVAIAADAVRERLQEVHTARVEALQAIYTLEESDLIAVMIYRYVIGKPWKEIAEKMESSEGNLYRLHGEALKRIRIEE